MSLANEGQIVCAHNMPGKQIPETELRPTNLQQTRVLVIINIFQVEQMTRLCEIHVFFHQCDMFSIIFHL
jgi:hypothetical protein